MELGQVLGIDRVLVDSDDCLADMVSALEAAPKVAFDTETTGLDYLSCRILGVSFSNGERAWYVPVEHSGDVWCAPRIRFVDWLRTFFARDKEFIAQNFKYDYQVLRSALGVTVEGTWHDTMIEGWLVDENTSHGLKQMTERYLGYKQATFEEVAGKDAKFQDAPIEKAAAYAADDAAATFVLHQFLQKKLEEDGLTQVYRNVEMPMVRVLADMELHGVCIDWDYLAELKQTYIEEASAAEAAITETIGQRINLNSTKQLAKVLYEQLGYPILGTTASGAPSTKAEVMTALALRGYDVAVKIERYKKLVYLRSKCDELRHAKGKDGRIHGHLNQTGTHTGRLSSSEPNLQNIPVRSDDGKRIRKAFIAGKTEPRVLVSEAYPDGITLGGEQLLINADYSQIELRVLAHFSQDPAMCAAFREGRDLHVDTASRLSGVPYERYIEAMKKDKAGEPLNEEDQALLKGRQRAKNTNFGIPYGQSYRGLAYTTGMSEAEAKQFLRRHSEVYSGCWDFIGELKRILKKQGYVTMLFGRRRRIPDANSSSFAQRGAAERQAINNKIQGSAGDLIKGAMIRLHFKVLPQYGAKLILQIHDELLIECPKETIEDCAKAVHDTMVNVVQLRVPIDADVRICSDWMSGH